MVEFHPAYHRLMELAKAHGTPRLVAWLERRYARVLEGSGHSPHWERPDAFNATVIGFLQQKPREAPSAR